MIESAAAVRASHSGVHGRGRDRQADDHVADPAKEDRLNGRSGIRLRGGGVSRPYLSRGGGESRPPRTMVSPQERSISVVTIVSPRAAAMPVRARTPAGWYDSPAPLAGTQPRRLFAMAPDLSDEPSSTMISSQPCGSRSSCARRPRTRLQFRLVVERAHNQTSITTSLAGEDDRRSVKRARGTTIAPPVPSASPRSAPVGIDRPPRPTWVRSAAVFRRRSDGKREELPFPSRALSLGNGSAKSVRWNSNTSGADPRSPL